MTVIKSVSADAPLQRPPSSHGVRVLFQPPLQLGDRCERPVDVDGRPRHDDGIGHQVYFHNSRRRSCSGVGASRSRGAGRGAAGTRRTRFASGRGLTAQILDGVAALGVLHHRAKIIREVRKSRCREYGAQFVTDRL